MIASLTPFSLLDYPNKLSCILWFGGCNLRCKYCYNHELITPKNYLPQESVLEFLHLRMGLLDGVVCSGGECTLWGEKLIEFVDEMKSMGYSVKIDTNGSNPSVLRELVERVDYVAMDFKAPMGRFEEICGKSFEEEFVECFEILKASTILHEIRTTFHSSLLSPQEIEEMRDWLRERGYNGEYYIQGYVGEKGSLGNMGESNNALVKELSGIIYRGK